MENPGLLSKTSTVAKAVTSAALHSKNQHKIWMVQISFRKEEKQCPLKDLGKQKEEEKGKKEKIKEKKRKKQDYFFPEWVTHKLK